MKGTRFQVPDAEPSGLSCGGTIVSTLSRWAAVEGLTLWFLCGLKSQKARNLAHDNRVSITIDQDTPDIMSISGLSMAARAHRVSDRAEAEKVIGMLPPKYPDAPPEIARMKMPVPEDVALFRVVPEVVSVLDYTMGFAHTDLVTC